MRKVTLGVAAALAAVVTFALGSYAFADDTRPSGTTNKREMVKSETLTGYQETPGVSSTGVGFFEAELDDETQTITYTLTYAGIEGGAVTQAHIHFGNRFNAGGVSAFLCNGPAAPPCPPVAGTVTDVITAAEVIGPVPQGIEPGAMAELMRAMRSGESYVNVHSTRFPQGEIRAQIADRDQRQPQ